MECAGTANAMFSYFIRRLLYTVPIILGVMIITFLLFFAIQKPETMARVRLGIAPGQSVISREEVRRALDDSDSPR